MAEEQGLSAEGEQGPFSRLVDQEWQGLLDKDDRNSPAEYPNMLLITRTELANAMTEAPFAIMDRARSEGPQPPVVEVGEGVREKVAREIALEILELFTADEIEQFVWPEDTNGDTCDRARSRADRIISLLGSRHEG